MEGEIKTIKAELASLKTRTAHHITVMGASNQGGSYDQPICQKDSTRRTTAGKTAVHADTGLAAVCCWQSQRKKSEQREGDLCQSEENVGRLERADHGLVW